jgi:hypothetical protein
VASSVGDTVERLLVVKVDVVLLDVDDGLAEERVRLADNRGGDLRNNVSSESAWWNGG